MTPQEIRDARWGHWTVGQMSNHGMRQFDKIAAWLAAGHSRRDCAVWADMSLSRLHLLVQQARAELKLPKQLSGKAVARAWVDCK